jgi:hypothetical protein
VPKSIILVCIIFTNIATSAVAGTVVDIRHPSLRAPKGAAIIYWCLTKNEIPAEYQGHPMPAKPMRVEETGALIVTQLDSNIFLTSEERLDQTKNVVAAAGGDPESLMYTTK